MLLLPLLNPLAMAMDGDLEILIFLLLNFSETTYGHRSMIR
jgi:hypothetical protein